MLGHFTLLCCESNDVFYVIDQRRVCCCGEFVRRTMAVTHSISPTPSSVVLRTLIYEFIVRASWITLKFGCNLLHHRLIQLWMWHRVPPNRLQFHVIIKYRRFSKCHYQSEEKHPDLQQQWIPSTHNRLVHLPWTSKNVCISLTLMLSVPL